MQIITADERMAERRGAKILLQGPTAIGKTWQLRTLDPAQTLFVDCEAGDLAVFDLPVPTIRIDDWASARDLACRIGGPNKSFPPTAAHSPAHFEAIGGYLENLDQYRNIFVDSLTAISRLSFRLGRATAGSFQRAHRPQGHAQRLRPARARNDPVAQPASARARQERNLCRDPRACRRRAQAR
jgi:hypothetical protein